MTPLAGFPVVTGSGANTVAGKIDQGGTTVWYTFTVPAGPSQSAWIDLDLSGTAGVDGFDLNPFITVYDVDGMTALAGGNLLLIRDLALAPGTYTLAVTDDDGGFSSSHHGFRPRVTSAGNLYNLTDDGSHTAKASALAVPNLPAVIDGNAVAGAQSWFALGTLTAGTSLTLDVDEEGGFLSLGLTLYGADGTTVVATDDDIFPALDGVILPSTQAYYASLAPDTADDAGLYELDITTAVACSGGTASAPLPNELAVNEIFANPSGANGDANKDGTTNSGDQFVELVNFGGDTRSLADVIVRDAQGVRFRGCNQTVGQDLAFTIFGGCTGNNCGGVITANSDPEQALCPIRRRRRSAWTSPAIR